MSGRQLGILAGVVLWLGLSGCLKLGPDYQRPDTGVDEPARFRQDQQTTTPLATPDDRWWEDFANPEIDRMVQAVLENNLNIRQATARIRELEARLGQVRADRFPALGLQAGWQKQHQTVTNPLTGAQDTGTMDSWSLSAPASYELDLWGRLARAEEAARADLLAVEENRRTIAQSLVAEAVRLYLQMESLERRIDINRTSVDTFRVSADVVESRYSRGLSTILALRQSRRLLAEAEAILPALEQEMGLVQQQMAVLQGAYPDTTRAREHPREYFRNMPDIPPGLPSDLLVRRPDIRRAEARLQALNARVGVAKASRFPRISLTANFGYASNDLGDLFRPESELWNLAAGVAQPVFDAGKLADGQAAAEAAYAGSVAEYAQTVLTAFSDVEGALLIRKQQLERRKRTVRFLEEARATQETAQSRYRRGLASYLSVLDAQQSRYIAEDRLIQVDLAILANRVNLYRALGGGWGEITPPDGPTQSNVLQTGNGT